MPFLLLHASLSPACSTCMLHGGQLRLTQPHPLFGRKLPRQTSQQRPGRSSGRNSQQHLYCICLSLCLTMAVSSYAVPEPCGSKVDYPTIEDCVGSTPLVRLQRLPGTTSNVILAKLEGNNPAGSVKDRPALSMIMEAERRGRIKQGDTLIEATSGNTGIALAQAAAMRGFKMKLIMPANMSEERKSAMAAFGAELISIPSGADGGGMEAARDLAHEMEARGEGIVLDQFSNPDNPTAHLNGTGPEVWQQTQGRITHFISSMGTTGTIMGVSKFLKGQRKDIQIVGLQPKEGARIPGIRRWPKEYLPKIFQADRVDTIMDIGQREAEETMRALARVEGIAAGVSSGGAVSAALRLSAQVENATIVAIICDRADRYLSTGLYTAEAGQSDPQPCHLDDWRSGIARLVAYPKPHFVLFTADTDAQTGRPWCPDCARCLEPVRQQVQTTGGTLLEVEVGDRPTWKNPAHPFRQDTLLKLSGIPTLMHWTESGPASRVDSHLERAPDPDAAADIVAAFIKSVHELDSVAKVKLNTF